MQEETVEAALALVKPGGFERGLIVEIKKAHDREHPIDGERGAKAMATRAWVDLNPERLKYEMIFTNSEEIGFDQTRPAREFIDE